jgi:hypothetical protein
MLESLESSGSDMVKGDHLKFSATRTWSPTRRWYAFDGDVSGARPVEVAPLLGGRACWNRLFRRSFWDEAALRFPDVASVEDIEPMTRAFVEARSIDVVSACVYLYRDRGDTSSLSVRSDEKSTLRYLEQELHCARLLVDRDERLRRQHAEVVYDADGWAHLQRFLAAKPDAAAIRTVAYATGALVRTIPTPAHAAAPVRQMLWSLALADHWAAAAAFVDGVSSGSAVDELGAWIDAVVVLREDDETMASALASGGLLPVLVNTADSVPDEWLEARLPRLRDLTSVPSQSELVSAMASAVSSGEAALVSTVAALRHLVPVVVSHAESSADGLLIGGRLPGSGLSTAMVIELSGATTVRVPLQRKSDGHQWSARVAAGDLGIGRHEVHVLVPGVRGRFPVVTARMPLPPVDAAFALQPLADRKNGWRFLVDRRPTRRPGIRGLLGRAIGRGR